MERGWENGKAHKGRGCPVNHGDDVSWLCYMPSFTPTNKAINVSSYFCNQYSVPRRTVYLARFQLSNHLLEVSSSVTCWRGVGKALYLRNEIKIAGNPLISSYITTVYFDLPHRQRHASI